MTMLKAANPIMMMATGAAKYKRPPVMIWRMNTNVPAAPRISKCSLLRAKGEFDGR